MKADEIKTSIGDFFNRMNEKNPYFVIGGFLLILFLLDFFLVMQFQFKTLANLNQKIRALHENVTKSELDIQRFAAYQNELKRLQTQYTQIESQVRTKDQLPLILENISRIANHNGLRTDQMMPNTALTEPLSKNNDGQYFAIPIRIEGRSEYHDFGRFLNQLENEEIFMRVPEFVIRASRDDQSRHEVELTLEAIVFEEKAE